MVVTAVRMDTILLLAGIGRNALELRSAWGVRLGVNRRNRPEIVVRTNHVGVPGV